MQLTPDVAARRPSPAVASAPFVRRQSLFLRPDPGRVVVRAFRPAVEPRDLKPADKARATRIVDRVLSLSEAEAAAQLHDVLEAFAGRHRNLLALFETRADEMEPAYAQVVSLSQVQRRLMGAYFSLEYAYEASALFNPSIVCCPDQNSAPEGGCRFILSVRAVGEGHISSLAFRRGAVTATGQISLDPVATVSEVPKVVSRHAGPAGDQIEIAFDPATEISERVIFPVTESQSNGIEDARFVLFDDAGERMYYATYTAYSGRAIRSELLATSDFVSFRMAQLSGSATHNKGMALFPRRIDGRFAMIGRQDNENLYLIMSDDIHAWEGGIAMLKPRFPWEFVQIGNCGSPIELDEGWLLLTHGVGPLRRYSIGAALLDKQDPSKVLARSREPLVGPELSERNGYVPNVVYTCGAMRLGSMIVLPFAVSDTFSTFATVGISDLLASMAG
jgi:predicted GH43/DUF377 family glycosyl hydrolase